MTAKAEIEDNDGGMGQQFVGLHARLINRGLRELNSLNHGWAVIIINQIRENVGVRYGNPETLPGGKAQRFVAWQIIRTRRAGWIEEGIGKDKKRVGYLWRIVIEKNKQGEPWRECTLPFYFTGAIDETASLLDVAIETGIIARKGSWYDFGDLHVQGLKGLRDAVNASEAGFEQIKEANKHEIHFIMYVGAQDFKDIYGFRKRHRVFRKDVVMSEVRRDDQIRYNLRAKGRDDFFSASEKEYFIIKMLDGKHGLEDLVRKFSDKYGSISAKSVNRFINTLDKEKFLEPEFDLAFGAEYQEEEARISLLEKILSFEYSVPNVHKIVTFLYGKLKWMFSIPVVLLAVFSLGLFLFEKYHLHVAFHLGNVLRANAHNPWIIVDYYAIMLFTVVCHEFAHALTCKRYGGEVNRMGIMLYYFQVAAYADTSDAWLFKERHKRILTSLNGPLLSLFVASVFFWLYYMVTPPTCESALHSWLWSAGNYLGIDRIFPPAIEQIFMMVVAANILVCLLNLLPFTLTDGYYILSDLTDSPNVRTMAMGYVLNVFRRLLRKPPYPVHPRNLRAKLLYALYGTLCLVYGAGAAAFVLYFFLFMHDIALHSVFGIFLSVTIGLFLLKGLFLRKIQKKREFLRKKVRSY